VLPEDGPVGPKHVGAKKNYLNTICSIVRFNKQCIRWKK
jgi:hypothetical protein